MLKIIFLPIYVLYKSYLKYIQHTHDQRIVRKRLRFTTNDFKKKCNHITPLTDAEKNEIIDFWKPYCPDIKKRLDWIEFYKSFYDTKCNRWTRHPQGAIFKGIQIVGYHQCVDLVKSLAGRLNSISKLISWDFAIGVDGAPIIIEANYTYGQFDFHQLCNGPILQELTETERDNVLHLVFKNKE